MSNHKKIRHKFTCVHCKKEVTEIAFKFVVNRTNPLKKQFCKECKRFRHSHWRKKNPFYYIDYRINHYDKIINQERNRKILKDNLFRGDKWI